MQAPNPTVEAGGASHQDDQPSTPGQGIISHTYLCNMSALWHQHKYILCYGTLSTALL